MLSPPPTIIVANGEPVRGPAPTSLSLNEKLTTVYDIDLQDAQPLHAEPERFADPGTLPDDIYDGTLAWWRAGLRRIVIQNLKAESRLIAAMQERIRTPWLDAYFVYTSSLGTHTFFMTFIPALFFFGYSDAGRGLISVLSLGCYCVSFLKDLLCVPRPYSPPVTRLTMGSHHREYGFPSTHSTNSVSIALHLYAHVRAADLAPAVHATAAALLVLYVGSIVGGRLYTAMHSTVDCAAGLALGTAVWAVHARWGAALETWVMQPGWTAPVAVVVIGLVVVHKHPQPVDDCPCFEDAIAFVSVVVGQLLAQWYAAQHGASLLTRPGAGVDSVTWALFAALRLVIGILLIFAWRMAAKSVLHAALPPVFRLAARAVALPTRRFYTPATEYAHMPPETGLHPIPSVIDLPAHMGVEAGADASGAHVGANPYRALGLKARGGGAAVRGRGRMGELEKNVNAGTGEDAEDEAGPVRHYDADVLTKVFVYCGIGILATERLPAMFEAIGWNVHM